MKISDLVRRVDDLIKLGNAVMATRYSDGYEYPVEYVQDASMSGFRSACLSFIERVYGKAHTHFDQFTRMTNHHYYSDVDRAVAILEAIRSELEGGWLFDIKNLVAAELFADFLEQAEYLLEQGFKDAAAVMIGSVLEEHLRQLCQRHSIDTYDLKDEKLVPRKADRINSELARASVYSALDAKQVTAWFGLRNSAAHGDYAAYTNDQVKNLATGVLGFISRNPI